MLDYKYKSPPFFYILIFSLFLSPFNSLVLDISRSLMQKGVYDTLHNMTVNPEQFRSLLHHPHPNHHHLISITKCISVHLQKVFFVFFFFFFPPFFFFIFSLSVTLLLFLLETSELVLDGEGGLLRLRCLQVDVDLLFLFLRLRRCCLLWRGRGQRVRGYYTVKRTGSRSICQYFSVLAVLESVFSRRKHEIVGGSAKINASEQ